MTKATNKTPQEQPQVEEPGRLRLAGMAMANGVLVIGPTHWAATIRHKDGSLETAVRQRPKMPAAVDRYPLLRGPIRLGEMMAVLPAVRRALPDARLALETRRVLGGTLGTAAAMHVVRRVVPSARAAEFVGAGLSLGVLLASLRGEDIAAYHGAEHKAIGGYEQGIPAEDATKEHDRCGTQLAVPMFVANLVAVEGLRMVMPGRPAAARLLGSGVGIAFATELARSMQRGATDPLARLVGRIGIGLQSVASTKEPTAEQLEVATASLEAVLKAEASTAA